MYVSRMTSFDQVPLAPAEWDRLAGGRFFLTWTWLECWWRHYQQDAGNRHELYILGVYDDAGRVIGLAPWYLERTTTGAGVVRFLGSGEVCSDHQTLLCPPGRETEVAGAIAEWLADERPTVSDWLTRQAQDRWDHLEFDCVDQSDAAMQFLCDQLAVRNCLLDRQPGLNCWLLDLPSNWEAYLGLLSKNRRAQARKAAARVADTEHFTCREVTSANEFEQGWSTLVGLHQRRWQSLGEPGCFASPRFTSFHHEVAKKLLERGELRLWWLEHAGRPISAEYQFVCQGTIHGYQSGLDPEALDLEPGRMTQVASKQWAIAHGLQRFDYLRGDEKYKSNWRAEPHPTWNVRVAAPRVAARFAHGVWLAKRNVKSWIKTGLRKAGYAR
ncbi:MAG: GNAT family N-acetyltransferase [Planctomycetia bacterium]|nr:GNAT family N-acetyltransferase [Planctomycetia bacterium]